MREKPTTNGKQYLTNTHHRNDALCAWFIPSDPLKKGMTLTQRGRRDFDYGCRQVTMTIGQLSALTRQTRGGQLHLDVVQFGQSLLRRTHAHTKVEARVLILHNNNMSYYARF
jgi:hypothetical protein